MAWSFCIYPRLDKSHPLFTTIISMFVTIKQTDKQQQHDIFLTEIQYYEDCFKPPTGYTMRRHCRPKLSAVVGANQGP